jgi:ATP-dependent 26S proteasome regulatory subunit
LKVHIICTLNAPVEKLDEALLRPGRLLTMREFKRLPISDAQRLAHAKGIVLSPQDDYSLAEIYATGQMEPTHARVQKRIGFDAL